MDQTYTYLEITLQVQKGEGERKGGEGRREDSNPTSHMSGCGAERCKPFLYIGARSSSRSFFSVVTITQPPSSFSLKITNTLTGTKAAASPVLGSLHGTPHQLYTQLSLRHMGPARHGQGGGHFPLEMSKWVFVVPTYLSNDEKSS